jgi:hypothetical protein
LKHYQNIELDAFVVMPNHIHGIIVIVDAITLVTGVGEGLRLQGKTVSTKKE